MHKIMWDTAFSWTDLVHVIRRECIYLWYYFDVQLRQIVWYWIIGMAAGSFISVFAGERIAGLLTGMQKKKRGGLGIIPAALIGIISPLCMYGTIPVAASFKKQGMREDWLAAFMMASILLNPQLIIYSAALGPAVLTVRIATGFLCGVSAGLCVRFFGRHRAFFDFKGFSEKQSRDTHPNPFIRYLLSFLRNVRATGIYFLLGILLSAAFQRYVPEEVMVTVFGGSRAWGVLMAATIGVPLYACGGGTIPLLQNWLMSGMSLGSAAAFMITGPATKITNLGALKIVMGMNRFLLYIAFVIAWSLAAGLIVNLLL